MTNITIQILKNSGDSAPGKLADAEIHFSGGELDGLKLVGFAVWQRRDGNGQNVTFPSRQFTFHGDRRSFSLLRWIVKREAQERLEQLVLAHYRIHRARQRSNPTLSANTPRASRLNRLPARTQAAAGTSRAFFR
jgi:hypothetical protein